MSGATDLALLLSSMAAELRSGSYVFSSVAGLEAAAGLDVLASVQELEGLSIVTAREDADRQGLTYDYVAAWITLRVHSALAAVGLTAAVSGALADAGISCNVVAGYHHDHLLVPLDRAADALGILRDLATSAGQRRERVGRDEASTIIR